VVPSLTIFAHISYFEKFLRQMDIFIRKTQKMIKSKFDFLGLDGTSELVWLDNLMFLFYNIWFVVFETET
jgi:hypothetical protein